MIDRLMILAAIGMVLYGIFNGAGPYTPLCLIIFMVFAALVTVLVTIARAPAPRRNSGASNNA